MRQKSKFNKTSLVIIIYVLLLFSTRGYADSPPISYYSNNPIVAEVDGERIYLDDLKHARIQEALVKLHQMQTLALKERLLKKLAKKHPEISLKKTLKISDIEIKRFYDNTPGIKELGNLMQLRGEIKDFLQ